jgi:hypothetical protein
MCLNLRNLFLHDRSFIAHGRRERHDVIASEAIKDR